jgi:cytoskeleton protein RodZ
VRAETDAVAAVGGAYVPQIYGAGTGNPRVVLIARLESWVQVRSLGGELLLTRILRPGDRYIVPNRGDLLMMTGNSGGLQIYVDGVAIAAIGPIGAVRRDISLDPQRLRPGGDGA